MTRACTLCVCLHHAPCEHLRDIMPREVDQTEAARSRSQLGPEGVRHGAESRAVTPAVEAMGRGWPLLARGGRCAAGGSRGWGGAWGPPRGPCAVRGRVCDSLCLHMQRLKQCGSGGNQ